MSKPEKLLSGLYIILKDHAEGKFPPAFDDQAKAYQAEIDYLAAAPGRDPGQTLEAEIRKPFWGAKLYAFYSGQFARLLSCFEELSLNKGSRLLELGCGSGWMTEFLAMAGYDVVGTSIAPVEIELAGKRVAACRAKGMKNELRHLACPMESVDVAMAGSGAFDGVFVFEALHHAFDWRKSIHASYRCLKTGGWLVVANEPNVLHTFISYRVAKIVNIHEVGMSRKALVGEMRKSGFAEIRVLAPKINNLLTHHWIVARK